MSKWDEIYCNLCRRILDEGVQVHNRTGVDTIKVPSASFQLDLSEEFPILTTKQLFIRQAVLEMLWIYQQQSNDVRWLQERGVNIWNEWEIDENGDWNDINTGKLLRHFDPEMAHTIGTAYGYVVKKYGLMDRLLDSIKNNPDDRRRVVSLAGSGNGKCGSAKLRLEQRVGCYGWKAEPDGPSEKLRCASGPAL